MGASRYFDGTSIDQIDLPNGALVTDSTPFTVMAWVHLDSWVDRWQGIAIIDTNQDATGSIKFFINKDNAGYKGLFWGSPGNQTRFSQVRSSDDISGDFAGNWKHVAVTFNGTNEQDYTNFKMYVDGESIATVQPGKGLSSPTDGQNIIGNDNSLSAGHWNGKIAYYQVNHIEMTAGQIVENMHRPGTTVEELKAFLPLWGVDSPEVDLSGNGNTGTVTGATESSDGPPVFFPSGPRVSFLPATAGGGGVTISPSVMSLSSFLSTFSLSAGAVFNISPLVFQSVLNSVIIKGGTSISPSVLALAGVLLDPNVRCGTSLSPSVLSLLAQLPSPGLSLGTSTESLVQELSAALQTPSVNTGTVVEAATLLLDVLVNDPTIDTGGSAQILASVLSIVCSVQEPDVNFGAVLQVAAQVLNTSLNGTTLSTGVKTSASTLELQSLLPSLEVGVGTVVAVSALEAQSIVNNVNFRAGVVLTVGTQTVQGEVRPLGFVIGSTMEVNALSLVLSALDPSIVIGVIDNIYEFNSEINKQISGTTSLYKQITGNSYIEKEVE